MSWDNRNLRCFNCRSWWPLPEGTGGEASRQRSLMGQCRRYAPPAQWAELPDRARHYPSWATTKRDDWCGEHAHQEM
ncbi:MAG: hypothetical protein P8Y53_07160 [Pseudolabrys sp.]